MAKRKGLVLDLGGAPNTYHTVSGYPGLFHPSVPTPVGEGEPISVEDAEKADRNTKVPLKLVDVSDKDIEASRELYEAALQSHRRETAELSKSASAAERRFAVEAAQAAEKE